MNSKFIIFVLIVITIYLLVNAYLFIRGWQALSLASSIRPIYSIIFIIFCVSFLAMMFGEGIFPDSVTAIIYPIGSAWLAAMLYFVMFALFFDIIRIINHFTHFYPAVISENYAKVKLIALGISIIGVGITLAVGYARFSNPVVTEIEISVPKKAGAKKELHIVMASDIHLSHTIRNKRVKQYVDQINSLNPDIVLFAGDIIDRDLNYVIKKDIAAGFKNLKAPLGVYTVLGNHEYISRSVDGSINYLEQSGIKVLRDSMVFVDSCFYVVGRDDLSNNQRKTLVEIIENIDTSLPLIVINHQPFHLEESEMAGVDLHLSGHTHDGQLFPMNLITDRMYEIAYGYKQKGNTHVYVSSGLGLWGPPFRVGTKSELVSIKIKFE